MTAPPVRWSLRLNLRRPSHHRPATSRLGLSRRIPRRFRRGRGARRRRDIDDDLYIRLPPAVFRDRHEEEILGAVTVGSSSPEIESRCIGEGSVVVDGGLSAKTGSTPREAQPITIGIRRSDMAVDRPVGIRGIDGDGDVRTPISVG